MVSMSWLLIYRIEERELRWFVPGPIPTSSRSRASRLLLLDLLNRLDPSGADVLRNLCALQALCIQ